MISRNRRKSLNIRVSSASPRLPRTSRNVARPVPNPYHPGMKWRVFVPANTPGKDRRAAGGPGAGGRAGRGAEVTSAASSTPVAAPGRGTRRGGAPTPPATARGAGGEAAVFVGAGVPTPSLQPPPRGRGGGAPRGPEGGGAECGGPPAEVRGGIQTGAGGGGYRSRPGGGPKTAPPLWRAGTRR